MVDGGAGLARRMELAGLTVTLRPQGARGPRPSGESPASMLRRKPCGARVAVGDPCLEGEM
jgi:hypothetical protein